MQLYVHSAHEVCALESSSMMLSPIRDINLCIFTKAHIQFSHPHTPGHNFHMGTQNGSKLEVNLTEKNLIHTLELKIWHFEV